MPHDDLTLAGHMLGHGEHEYFSIDYDVVWRVATSEMQRLIDYLTPIVHPSP